MNHDSLVAGRALAAGTGEVIMRCSFVLSPLSQNSCGARLSR